MRQVAYLSTQKSPRSRGAKGASSGALVRSLETSSSYSAIAAGISTFPYIVGGWLLELQRAVPSAPLDESVQIQLLASTLRPRIAGVNPLRDISHKSALRKYLVASWHAILHVVSVSGSIPHSSHGHLIDEYRHNCLRRGQ